MKKKSGIGFTLIELMLVSAIIGILAVIAIPKFVDMVIRAREAAVMGKVGAIRGAIAIYYSDNEGYFPLHVNFDTGAPMPPSFFSPLVPKYMEEIPKISIPTVPSHLPGNSETGNFVGDFIGPPIIAYAYDRNNGIFRVACTHPDSKGVIWSTK